MYISPLAMQLPSDDQLNIQIVTMATKYAFAQGLKELRFHLCQKSDHSAAAR